jgi:hypothetical protein
MTNPHEESARAGGKDGMRTYAYICTKTTRESGKMTYKYVVGFLHGDRGFSPYEGIRLLFWSQLSTQYPWYTVPEYDILRPLPTPRLVIQLVKVIIVKWGAYRTKWRGYYYII